MEKGIKNIHVRFYLYGQLDDDFGVHEVDEAKFEEANGTIEYCRDTVYVNGVNQICLTKTLD